MALYEDFELDITVETKQETIATVLANTKYCPTYCETCEDCSFSCGGVSHMACDR